MTCCISIKTPDGVMCAADGQLENNNMVFDITDKIFRAGSSAIMTAGGGSDTESTAIGWMKTDGTWTALVEIVSELKEDEKTGGDFLWTDGDIIKLVMSGGCISRSPTWFHAIGIGRQVAIGYLAASRQPGTREEAQALAEAVLNIVSQYVSFVGPPHTFEWVTKR
jgi:20S proteasome alpha/beta subunit